MLHDIIEIKNFFKKPHEILAFAKNQTYYNQQEYLNKTKDILYPQWQGYRTEMVHLLDEKFFIRIGNRIVKKTLEETFYKNCHCVNFPNFNYIISCHFHYMTEQEKMDPSWIHRDTHRTLMGGVVYLSENPSGNSGTTIIDKNDNKISIKNEFNKMVMFNGNFLHTPQNGFGDSLDNARLTLVFFIEQIDLFGITER